MIKMNKRKELLEKHPYKIWESKNGKWYTYLYDQEKKRKLIKRNTQSDLENTIIQYYEENNKLKEENITFNDAYYHWRSVQDVLISSNSIVKYNTDYDRFFKNTDFISKYIKNITEEDIKLFIVTTVKTQKLCKKACKTLFGYIKNTINSAIINHYIDASPMGFLEAKQFYKYCIEVERDQEKILASDSELKKIYEQICRDYERKPEYIPTYAVHLATLTGMRVGEISALSWEDITDSYIIIRQSEKYDRIKKEYFIDKTKNGKERIFPMTDEIRNILDKVKRVEMQNGYICKWVFANENGRIHAPIISSCSKNKCRQAGVTDKGIHAYRRTINSKMRCDGVSATLAASLLGHTEEVNEQYYTFDISTIKQKAEIVSKINSRYPIAE